MCGTRPSAQTSPFAKIPFRAVLLGAAISLVLVAPASAGVDCVMGSKAAPAELIPACGAIIDQPQICPPIALPRCWCAPTPMRGPRAV